MKPSLIPVVVASLVFAGCGNHRDTPTPKATNSASSNPLDAPADYLNGLANSRDLAVGTVDLASLKQAIQVFNVNEGRYPKSLDELVSSKMIGQIPPTPRGKKLSYDPATGDVSLVNQ